MKGKTEMKDAKKKKMPLKTIIIIAIVLVVLTILIAIFAGKPAFTGKIAFQTANEEKQDQFEEFVEAESIEGRLKKQYQPDRSAYGSGILRVADENITFNIIRVFDKLPSLPEDFWLPKYEMSIGQILMSTIENLSENYYKQPEFYGDSFHRNFGEASKRSCGKGVFDPDTNLCLGGCIAHWKEPLATHQFTEGYAVFPLEIGLRLKPGQSSDVYTFARTSCGVQTYQGLKLVPEYPSWGRDVDGAAIEVDAELAKKHLDMKIDPQIILLAPAYPQYERGWTKKVKITVTADKDTPPGIYALGMNFARVPEEFEKEWEKKYREKYQSKSGFKVTPTSYPSFFNLFIEIEGNETQ